MKLSESTIEILKNFSSINPGLVVKPGNILRTISTNKAVLAQAEVTEDFPKEFGIYDLNKVLGVLSLHENPEVDFAEEYLVLSSAGSRRSRVRYSDVKVIIVPPDKQINIATFDVKINLSERDLKWIEETGSVLKCPHVIIQNDGKNVVISAADAKGEGVDDSTLFIGENTSGQDFKFVLKVENLRLLPGDYTVEIASKGISKFSSKNVTYWVAVEKNLSEFGQSNAEAA